MAFFATKFMKYTGHSRDEVLFKHYKAWVNSSDAKAFSQLRPPDPIRRFLTISMFGLLKIQGDE